MTPEQEETISFRRARYSRVGRMRRYRHKTLLAAMRPHSFGDLVMIQTCRAFDVLPEEIGISR